MQLPTGRYYSGRTSAVINLDPPWHLQAQTAVIACDANHHIDVDENDESTNPSFLPSGQSR
jgi:hypothetical protein